MNTNLRKYLVACLFVTLTSCLSSPDLLTAEIEEKFLKIAAVSDMNESLQIEINKNNNTLNANSQIPLLIHNRSDNFLVLDAESHKIFVPEDDNWVEVTNQIDFRGEMILSPQGTPLLDLGNTWVKPALEENVIGTKDKILVRITIICEILNNNVRTGEFIGAYTDVYLTP